MTSGTLVTTSNTKGGKDSTLLEQLSLIDTHDTLPTLVVCRLQFHVLEGRRSSSLFPYVADCCTQVVAEGAPNVPTRWNPNLPQIPTMAGISVTRQTRTLSSAACCSQEPHLRNSHGCPTSEGASCLLPLQRSPTNAVSLRVHGWDGLQTKTMRELAA